MNRTNELKNEKKVVKLIAGTFSKCYYCDVDNQLCRKYNQPKNGWNEIGDWTWENYCLKDGGCDR